MLVRTLEYGQHISSIIINEGVIVRKGNTYTMPVDGIAKPQIKLEYLTNGVTTE